MNIAEIIKRVEAATGDEREIDAMVGRALGVKGKPRNVHRRGHYVGGKPVLLRVAYDFPAYTASVDVVIQIIEGKMGKTEAEWYVGRPTVDGPYHAALRGHTSGPVDDVQGEARTPALALLLAFLRALEARGEKA